MGTVTVRFGLLLVLAQCLAAQDPLQITVAVRAEKGFLTVDEVRTIFTATGFHRDNQDIRRTLLGDVNAALRQIGRLCNQALGLDPAVACPANARPVSQLTAPDWAGVRKAWDAWRAGDAERRPSIDTVFSDNAGPIVSLGRILPQLTALSFDASVDTVDSGAGTLIFTILPPVREWSFATPVEGKETVVIRNPELGPAFNDEARLRRVFEPFTGGLWRRSIMERALNKAYPEDRVIRFLNDPNDTVFVATADAEARRVQIAEGARLFSIEVADTVPDRLVGRAFYLLLPYAQFRAQGKSRKREYPAGSRPLIDAALLGRVAGLKSAGLAAQPFLGVQGVDGVRVLSVVPDGSTQTAAPGSQPAIAALPGWVRLEGGGRYEPGQGITAMGAVSFQLPGAKAQSFTVRAGGNGAGPQGDLNYDRDFLFFDSIRRHLGLNVSASSETANKRILSGITTDERRWSVVARGTLELVPDRDSTFLNVWVEAERTTVVLQPAVGPTASVKFAGINTGGRFAWHSNGPGLRRTVSFDPKLETGLALADSLASFQAGWVNGSFAQELGAGIDFHFSGRAAIASNGTPLVEQPVLGGPETVRGYRRDEAIGTRLWSLQNEVWFPVPVGSAGGPLQWIGRNVKLAPFFDVGGLYHARQGGSGIRRGTGGGIRLQAVRGLFLKLDYGYGFDADPGRRRGRIYVSADMGF